LTPIDVVDWRGGGPYEARERRWRDNSAIIKALARFSPKLATALPPYHWASPGSYGLARIALSK
jgi:hypothetical protein